jgi:hypothetical protein
VGALRLMAAALADERIERLTALDWGAQDRWGDTPLQVCAWGARRLVCVCVCVCAPGGCHHSAGLRA